MSVLSKERNACISALLAAWLCGGLLYVLPNHGGAGLHLPQNLMTWAVMAFISLACAIALPFTKATKISADAALLLAGALCWSLPLLWSPEPGWRLNAIPKIAALWGMIGFYFVLLAFTSGPRLRLHWLAILAVAAVSQAGYALFQLKDLVILPGGRPYASFQQVNVLASFLAMGLACALWLFLEPAPRLFSTLSGVALFLLSAALMLLQSRAALLGAVISTIIMAWVVYRDPSKPLKSAVLILLSGCATGWLLLHAGRIFFPDLMLPLVDKDGSNSARLMMLKLTWQMIMQHPFMGNGYGSFEAQYGQLAQWMPQQESTVKYPHNELLYAWAEGGVVALGGVLLMICGIVHRLWGQGGARYIGIALLMPIAVHMNLEYPLYQSASHALALIMLLMVCGGAGPEEKMQPARGYWRVAAGFSSLAILIFMLTGLQTQARLTVIEQQELLPLALNEQAETDAMLNVYSQYDRLDFDRHVALLMRFNKTKDPVFLDAFRRWAQVWLQVHNDPSVYFSLIMIAHAQRSPEENVLCQQAHRMWSKDTRFQCPVE